MRTSQLVSLAIALSSLIVAFDATAQTTAVSLTSLGYREDTVIEPNQRDECPGTLAHNHDESFENGYSWSSVAISPPFYGSWGEGYDLGSVNIECAVYWLTTISGWAVEPYDLYIWDGGVEGPPATVRWMITGVLPQSVPWWPSIGVNQYEVGCCVDDEFTVGIWPTLHNLNQQFFCAADENGSGGYPWTCVAPGLPYPSGWQDVRVIHPECASMGIGVTVTEVPSPVESRTWGKVKSMFRQ